MWIPMRRLRLDMRTRSAGPRRLSRSLLAGGLIALAASGAGAAQRLQVGLGDRYDQMVNGKRVVVYQTAAKDGLRFKYVALWLTPGWPEWVRKPLLERIIRDGYTPVLIYYTFGDSSGKETLEKDGRAALKAWYADIEKNLVPLVDVGSEVLVVLEPEFNVIPASGTPITAWAEWNEIAGKAIDMLHKGARRCKVGLCPGDWGNYNLEKCMKSAARKSDFIAFPEMRAAKDPTADTTSAGYRDVIGAALRFTAYLKESFHKPILWAYLALSSHADSDSLGWQDIQAQIIDDIFLRENELIANGVFGLIFFSYFDDPSHGTYFFGEAERHFGLKDAQGRPKKAWRVWKADTSSSWAPASRRP